MSNHLVRTLCIWAVIGASMPLSVSAIEIDGPVPSVSLLPTAELTGDQGLRLATLNVQAYVAKHRPDRSPLQALLKNAEVMDPRAAAAAIAKLENRRGLHHRLALLDLLSWKPEERDVEEQVRAAVTTLVGADKVDVLLRSRPEPDDGDACQGSDWEEEQKKLNALLNKEVGPIEYKQCDPLDAILGTVIDSKDQANSIAVVAKVLATAPLDSTEKGLDPQRWNVCSSLWSDSYLVALDVNGNVTESGCNPPNNASCKPNPGATRPWDVSYDTDRPLPRRPLFERFVCDKGWCDVRILLHIVTKVSSTAVPPAESYSVDYQDPVPWKAFASASPDYGRVFVLAKDIGQGSRKELTVESSKVFGFSNWGTNTAIFYMLKRIQMSRYLADLVCCNP